MVFPKNAIFPFQHSGENVGKKVLDYLSNERKIPSISDEVYSHV
jgi:hypothetical protein